MRCLFIFFGVFGLCVITVGGTENHVMEKLSEIRNSVAEGYDAEKIKDSDWKRWESQLQFSFPTSYKLFVSEFSNSLIGHLYFCQPRIGKSEVFNDLTAYRLQIVEELELYESTELFWPAAMNRFPVAIHELKVISFSLKGAEVSGEAWELVDLATGEVEEYKCSFVDLIHEMLLGDPKQYICRSLSENLKFTLGEKGSNFRKIPRMNAKEEHEWLLSLPDELQNQIRW